MNTQPGEYVRPEIPEQVLLDDAGAHISYGDRWGYGMNTPDDAYSKTSHPERFAPLQTVARALIDHLVSTYDVEQRGDFDAVHHAVRLEPAALTDAVTLVPQNPKAAPLSFLFTDFPSTTVLAGAYYEEPYPVCGCDACDDQLEGLIESMELDVLAVAQGKFREYVAGTIGPFIHWDKDNTSTMYGGSSAQRLTWREAAQRRRRLRPFKDGWQPWPLRSAP